MIIEIDIRIEDSDGRVLHRFENKYDDKLSTSIESQDYTDDAGMDFCDFLSEYLSCSGSLLREKLFQGNYTMKRDRYRRKGKKTLSKHSNETNPNSEVSQVRNLEDSELEYRIRIGDDKVLVGKIPLKLQPSTTSVTLQLKEDMIAHPEIKNPSDTETAVETNPDNDFEQSKVYDEITDNMVENKDNQIELGVKYNTQKNVTEVDNKQIEVEMNQENHCDISNLTALETDTEIDSILNYAMMKAIEKYELNLAPSCDA